MKPRRQARAPAANEANPKGNRMKDLEGKVAIVTAAPPPDRRGRGARAARLRRARRRAGRGRRGRRKVAAADPQGCRAWQVDITDDARLEQRAEAAARHFGRLDFLVNLAATYLDDGAASGRADWLRALDINLVSAVMARAARPPPGGLRRRRHRQLHQHLGQGRADGPLALSGVQGRAGAAHTQHGDGSPATASASIRCRQAGPGRA